MDIQITFCHLENRPSTGTNLEQGTRCASGNTTGAACSSLRVQPREREICWPKHPQVGVVKKYCMVLWIGICEKIHDMFRLTKIYELHSYVHEVSFPFNPASFWLSKPSLPSQKGHECENLPGKFPAATCAATCITSTNLSRRDPSLDAVYKI